MSHQGLGNCRTLLPQQVDAALPVRLHAGPLGGARQGDGRVVRRLARAAGARAARALLASRPHWRAGAATFFWRRPRRPELGQLGLQEGLLGPDPVQLGRQCGPAGGDVGGEGGVVRGHRNGVRHTRKRRRVVCVAGSVCVSCPLCPCGGGGSVPTDDALLARPDTRAVCAWGGVLWERVGTRVRNSALGEEHSFSLRLRSLSHSLTRAFPPPPLPYNAPPLLSLLQAQDSSLSRRQRCYRPVAVVVDDTNTTLAPGAVATAAATLLLFTLLSSLPTRPHASHSRPGSTSGRRITPVARCDYRRNAR